jgi:hypothetical protein
MVKTALVAADEAMGSRVLGALDSADLSIGIALWLYAEEYEDWRFVLASPSLDATSPAGAYGLVHDALDRAGIPYVLHPTLMILKMSDPFVRGLRRIFGKSRTVEGMRLGLQTIGDRYVEDAVVYRIR